MLTPQLRRDIGALAARHHGVVTREELLALGIGRHALAWAIRVCVLRRLFPGVYALNGAPDTWRMRAVAAHRRVDRQLRRKDPVDRSPPLVAIGGASAAHIHELVGFGRAPGIVVSTSRRCRSRTVETATRHSLDPVDVTELDGITVTALAWTLLDVATTASRERVCDLVVQVLGRDRLGAAELAATAERATGVAGRHVVLEVLTDLTGRHRSLAEKRLADACIEVGLPPPDTNRTVKAAGRTYELDLYWEDVRLDIEVDGPHHLLADQRQRDRRRDRHLRDDGFEVVRIPVEDIDDDPGEAARRVARKHRLLEG